MVKAHPVKAGGKPPIKEPGNPAREGVDRESPCNIFTIILGSVWADCQAFTGFGGVHQSREHGVFRKTELFYGLAR